MRLPFSRKQPAKPAPAPAAKPRVAPRFSDATLAMLSTPKEKPKSPFELPAPMKGVLPSGAPTMAMDSGIMEAYSWANQSGV